MADLPLRTSDLDDQHVVQIILKLHAAGYRDQQVADYLDVQGCSAGGERKGRPTKKHIFRIREKYRDEIEETAKKFRERAMEDGYSAIEHRLDMLSQTAIELESKKWETDSMGKPVYLPLYFKAIEMISKIQGDIGLNERIDPRLLKLSRDMAAATQPAALPDAIRPAPLKFEPPSGEEIVIDAEVTALS
jgi:hypothetical protein